MKNRIKEAIATLEKVRLDLAFLAKGEKENLSSDTAAVILYHARWGLEAAIETLKQPLI